MNTHTKQTGFSIVEALILAGVLAIIGYVAYSAIRDHRIRGLVDYASFYSRDIEIAMNAYFKSHDEFPSDLGTLDLPDVKQSVYWDTGRKLKFRISLERDVMTFEFIDAPSAIVGKTLIFDSTVSDKQLHWTCVGGTIEVAYQPSTCRH